MIYPKKVHPGDCVGLTAPGAPVSQACAAQCRAALERLGFRVKSADNLSASKGGYMAGEETVRAAWLNRMFADPEVDAIFCLRGGNGVNRILDYLDLDVIRDNPKSFMGYSDVTSLHLLLNQQCRLITFHGPMVASHMIDAFDGETARAFFAALHADRMYPYRAPEHLPLRVVREGVARGPLVGGNLTVLCASLATPYEVDTRGKILFLEEVGASIGHMDRHIYQLRNAGKLREAAGILLGQFTRCPVEQEDYGIAEVVREATADLGIPVISHVQSGHGTPMITLPLGAVCEMNTDPCTIRFPVTRDT